MTDEKDNVVEPTEELTLEQIGNAQREYSKSQKNNGQAPQPKFWEEIKKNTGLEFKSYDDLKGLHSKATEYETKYKEVEPKLKEYETLSSQFKTIQEQRDEFERLAKENSDPLKFYGGKKEKYIQSKLEEKYPDREHLVKDVLTLNKQDDINAIITEMLWDDPTLERSDIIEHLNSRYDTDVEKLNKDPKEWDANLKVKIRLDAKHARQKLEGISGEINVPEFKDPTEQIKLQQKQRDEKVQQSEAKWNEVVSGDYAERAFSEILIPNLDKNGNIVKVNVDGKEVESEPLIVWKTEPDFIKALPLAIKNYVKTNDIEPTPENIKNTENLFKMAYVMSPANLSRILNERDKSRRAQWEAEKAIKDHVEIKEKNDDLGGSKKSTAIQRHYQAKYNE